MSSTWWTKDDTMLCSFLECCEHESSATFLPFVLFFLFLFVFLYLRIMTFSLTSVSPALCLNMCAFLCGSKMCRRYHSRRLWTFELPPPPPHPSLPPTNVSPATCSHARRKARHRLAQRQTNYCRLVYKFDNGTDSAWYARADHCFDFSDCYHGLTSPFQKGRAQTIAQKWNRSWTSGIATQTRCFSRTFSSLLESHPNLVQFRPQIRKLQKTDINARISCSFLAGSLRYASGQDS